ncbi:hypothetical protein [Burkholderia lata]|uniref:hypothetical protein n=1 Tax=Burkholderia lata (strain ATCC 17760 / DSM 23089 / LMG 22485 / NCIMB 9086 / R18194 / 383) TaxID=482957 RepID=UPI0015832CF4|nr:hypothetical protein [Burkholderia lata]
MLHATAINGTAIVFRIVLTDFSPGSLLSARHPVRQMLPVPDRVASLPTRSRSGMCIRLIDNQLSNT